MNLLSDTVRKIEVINEAIKRATQSAIELRIFIIVNSQKVNQSSLPFFFSSDLNFSRVLRGRAKRRDVQLVMKNGNMRWHSCHTCNEISLERSVQLSLPIWTRDPTKTFPISLLSPPFPLFLPRLYVSRTFLIQFRSPEGDSINRWKYNENIESEAKDSQWNLKFSL